MAVMTTSPKRRWFQWSLRRLLVVVTVAAALACLGWSEFEKWRQPSPYVRLLNEGAARAAAEGRPFKPYISSLHSDPSSTQQQATTVP
jgi:hypothetical protein